MREVTLAQPCSHLNVEDLITTLARELGLEIKAMTLAKYPGSTHWHLNKTGEKGTLEITWWPNADRVWASIRQDRHSPWVDDAIDKVRILLPVP